MAGQAMVGVNMQKDPSSDDGGRDRHKGVVKYWLFDKGISLFSTKYEPETIVRRILRVFYFILASNSNLFVI